MLTVWCVCVGDKYTDEDVHLLRAMVGRNLNSQHQFLCLSDRKVPGVSCLVPDEQWPGWWMKLLLFRYATEGHHLYFDLDSVIVGSLDRWAEIGGQLCMPKNWAQSGHGGCQSSVMSWGANYSRISDAFDPSLLRADPVHPHGRYGDTDLWGDQGFLTHLFGNPGKPEGPVGILRGVYSYKYHCGAGVPPEDARVIQFHGEPKPHQVSDPWVRAARSFTPT